jgi:aminoglycoside phosphotransferase
MDFLDRQSAVNDAASDAATRVAAMVSEGSLAPEQQETMLAQVFAALQAERLAAR